MKRIFNIAGCCLQEEHYMVNIKRQLGEIQKLVDNREYFVIARARQFGKTTTLINLQQQLSSKYIVFRLTFEGLSNNTFQDENIFCHTFYALINNVMLYYKDIEGISTDIIDECKKLELDDLNSRNNTLIELSKFISRFCNHSEKKIVLIVDEVDQAGNYAIFLNFLGMLRSKYLDRWQYPTFHSVILAGVYDIKNLKLKIRNENEHQYNSPWNIAANFNVDMSFKKDEIAQMLSDYDQDYNIEMNIVAIAELLYDYTSGYPFLVSRLCKIMDEEIPNSEHFPDKKSVWTKQGVLEAVRLLLKERNTLFDDMIKHLAEYQDLNAMLHNIIFLNQEYPYFIDNLSINIGTMFGFVKEKHNKVEIANRIFEMRLSDFYFSVELEKNINKKSVYLDKSQFTKNGYLDMDLVMQKFAEYYADIYRDYDQKFVEEYGYKLFLLYLRPIINGIGNFYKEVQTTDGTKMDIVVDYLGKQYVIELKIWRGMQYNQSGEQQLASYLDFYHLDKGYMLTFNFNKKKTTGIKEVIYNGKIIVETMV